MLRRINHSKVFPLSRPEVWESAVLFNYNDCEVWVDYPKNGPCVLHGITEEELAILATHLNEISSESVVVQNTDLIVLNTVQTNLTAGFQPPHQCALVRHSEAS